MDDLFLPEEIEPIIIGDDPEAAGDVLIPYEPADQPPASPPSELILVEETTGTATEANRRVPGQIGFADSKTAWTRLRDFHRRSLGRTDKFETAEANELSPEEAHMAYSNAAVLVTAQIAVVGPEMQMGLLNSLCDYAGEIGSLEGLESVFLDLARAAEYAGDMQALDKAAGVLGSVGLPGVLGGNVQYTTLFEVGTGEFSLQSLDQIRQGFGGFGKPLFDLGTGRATPEVREALGSLKGSAMFAGLGEMFGGGPPAFSSPDDMAMGVDQAASYGTIGTVIGACVGAVVGAAGGGGWGGAAIGVGIGGALGGAAGIAVSVTVDIARPLVETVPANRPAHPSTPAHHPSTTVHHPDPEHPSRGHSGGAHKCWEPDMSTGLPAFDGDPGEGDGGPGGGINWVPTVIPQGPGIEGLPVHLGGGAFQLPNLPRLDDQGRLQTPGFLGDLGFVTIPVGDGSDDVEWTGNPAAVTHGEDLDSPDPADPWIAEAPQADFHE